MKEKTIFGKILGREGTRLFLATWTVFLTGVLMYLIILGVSRI